MKHCSKCGEVKEESDYRLTRSGKSLMAMCIACVKSSAQAHAKKYAERSRELGVSPERKAKRAAYRKTETGKANRRRYMASLAARRPEILKFRSKRKSARSVIAADDGYIICLLTQQIGLHAAEISNELIALKREQLLNRRLQKQLIETIGETA
jgi:threonine dehydratase